MGTNQTRGVPFSQGKKENEIVEETLNFGKQNLRVYMAMRGPLDFQAGRVQLKGEVRLQTRGGLQKKRPGEE